VALCYVTSKAATGRSAPFGRRPGSTPVARAPHLAVGGGRLAQRANSGARWAPPARPPACGPADGSRPPAAPYSGPGPGAGLLRHTAAPRWHAGPVRAGRAEFGEFRFSGP